MYIIYYRYIIVVFTAVIFSYRASWKKFSAYFLLHQYYSFYYKTKEKAGKPRITKEANTIRKYVRKPGNPLFPGFLLFYVRMSINISYT